MKLPPGTIIAAGVVIIENGQVLLNKEIKFDGLKSPYWMFPGGTMNETDINLEACAMREAKEEVGIDVNLLKPLRTLYLPRPDREGSAILVHYLAERLSEVKPGEETYACEWFPVKELPLDCAPNVYEIMKDLV